MRCHAHEHSSTPQHRFHYLIHHPRIGVVPYIISVVFVCLSVGPMYGCQTITFNRLNVGSSYLHIRYNCREYRSNGSSSYMKIIASRSRSQEQNGRKSLFLQCKTSICNNSGSMKHRAMKFVCSMGFVDMAYRMA